MLERRLRNSGDPTRSGFVSGNRHPGRSQSGRELFLGKAEPLSANLSELRRCHVTNGYIDSISLSSVIESRLLLSAMFLTAHTGMASTSAPSCNKESSSEG